MRKVFTLGNGLGKYADQLRSKGFSVRAFSSPATLLKNIKSAHLLVINGSDARLRKEIAKKVRELPKVIIGSDSTDIKSSLAWTREPLSYPVFSPSATEMGAVAARAIREAGKIQKGQTLAAELSDARNEVRFLEQMSRVLMTSNSLSEIFSTFIRRAAKLSGANGWAYFLMDENSDEYFCKKSSAMAKVCSSPGNGKHCLASKVVKSKKAINASYEDNGKKSRKKSPLPPGYYLAVPVANKEKVFGVLELYNILTRGDFSQEDVYMLGKFADLAAYAIDKITIQQRLEDLVVTDDLTQLFNSRYLNRSLEAEIQRSRRYTSSVSLVFLDLDHFKDINDGHGHLVGSKLLAEVGQLLMSQLRNLDVVARYGGDEFVLLLPQTKLEGAMVIAERIRAKISNTVFLKKNRLNLKITGSFGVATYPETAKSKEDLIKIADDSMYNVKKNNRNGVYAII